MGAICACGAVSIPDIPIGDCPESMGQIQKASLQRVYSADTTKNTIADPTLLASWTPFLDAADSTKIVTSPYINEPTSEAGEPRLYGGGNTTRDGIELIIGSEPSTFTGNILRSKQDTIKAMKTMMCDDLAVWLIDENGNIGCLVDDIETPTAYYPIPIHAFFVGDKAFGNFEGVDMNGIQWKMRPNWSDNFVVVQPTDFNALTDLVATVIP